MSPVSLIRQDALIELAEEARRAPAGDLVEVGVYKGGSAAVLAEVAREQKRRLFLFDTFCGIPFADPHIDHHRLGDFADTSFDEVSRALPDAICVRGVFPYTLAGADLGPVALAHVDCDQYASVAACCWALGPRMVSGGVMVFDDYDALAGARKAVDHAFKDRVITSKEGKARVRF